MKLEASRSAWTRHAGPEVRPAAPGGGPRSPPPLPHDPGKQRFHSCSPRVDVAAPGFQTEEVFIPARNGLFTTWGEILCRSVVFKRPRPLTTAKPLEFGTNMIVAGGGCEV